MSEGTMIVLERGVTAPEPGNPRWLQFTIVRDRQTICIDMKPALFGWNFGQVSISEPEAWGDMTAEDIVAWKLHADDGLTRIAPADEAAKVIALVKGLLT